MLQRHVVDKHQMYVEFMSIFRTLHRNIYGFLKIIKSQKTSWFIFAMCTFHKFLFLNTLI
jgi:hypothetical protein